MKISGINVTSCNSTFIINFFIDAMAYRGDLIGCTVKFDKKEDGKVPIVFTLNGKQITQDKILMEYNPSEKSLYPFIGMGHTGIRVLAKVSIPLKQCDCLNWHGPFGRIFTNTNHNVKQSRDGNLFRK